MVKLSGYKRQKLGPGVERHTRIPAGKHTMSRAEETQPWIVFHYGLTHDRWWPPWTSTRVLGRMKVVLECAVCGDVTKMTLRIPRFGEIPVPAGGRHPARVRYCLDHLHEDRPNPMAWAKPLLNMNAHKGGLDLDLLKMRLEADLRAAAEDS